MKKICEKILSWLCSNVDKVIHFVVCGFLCLYASLYTFGFGVFLPVFLGVAKEIVDAIVREKKSGEVYFDWRDLLADILGMLFVAIPLYFLQSRGLEWD